MALLTNVCRLCLVTEDLVWVFDRKLPVIQNNSLKDIIFATSGVEIYQKDVISQKICSKCCQISMKMFQFREQSLKNDKILKNQYAELLKNAKTKLKIPNTEITITAEKVETKKEVKNDDNSNTRYRIHPSVTALFKDNPQIRLPSVCLKSNIAPCVSLEMHAVERYLRNRKLSIEKFSQLASKSTRKVAKKKGSAKPISKLKTFEVPKIPSPVSRSKCVDPLRVVSTRSTVKSGSTKENTHKLLPSNIKKHQDFKIVDVSKIRAQNNYKSSDDSDTSTRQKPIRLKRKRSTDDSSTKVEPKLPAIIESLGLTPKMKPNGDSTGTLYVDNNKSVPLFICDICNSVQYNAKDLKRHMLKHLRCQFCKLKFRSIDFKANHIEKYCRIKNMMNTLPAVELEKIELKLTVRRKYPEAFSGFPSLPGLELEKKDNSENYLNDEKSMSVESEKENGCDNNINDDKSTFVESTQKCTENTVPESSDIIEIISDDEDSTPRIASEPSTAVSETLIGSSKDKDVGISYAFSVNSSSPSTIHNIDSNVINKPPAATIINTTVSAENPGANTRNVSGSINQRNSVPVTLQNVSSVDLEQNSSSYVVKPEILIRNVSILDKFEPKATDTNIVKNLLIQLGKFKSDGTTQTVLPSNDSIIVNKTGRTIEMKNLRDLLFIYKIPVHINKGDFKISFNYEAPALREKKLSLWNDLVAIDLKGTNDNVDTVSSRTIPSPLPQSENTTTAADSFNTNSGVTIQQPTNINNQISTVMKSSQININPCVPVIATLNTGNAIRRPSAPSIMSCIQTPSISLSSNSTSITSDPCPVNSVSVDAETAAASTPISSKVSDIHTPSISFTPNSTNTSERPGSFINTMNTNAGQVTFGRPISSEMSCVQPPAISSDPISSSNSGSSAFFINTIAENAIINTPSLSEISCQPAENSFIQDSLSISSPSAFSINNVNAIAENTTTGTCIPPAIGCILPSPSISFNLPTTTSVHQISSTSVNTNAVTNTTSDVNRSCEDSAAINIPLTLQDAFPISESLTPISTALAPINTSLTPVSTSLTPISTLLTPVSAPLTPVSAPLTPVSAPLTHVSAPVTHVSAPVTHVSAPQPPMITPFIPVSATLDSSPALPLNSLPTSTVTETNSVSVADSGPVSNSVAVAGRVGIRVKNLCELT